jgi:hypothetical protein
MHKDSREESNSELKQTSSTTEDEPITAAEQIGKSTLGGVRMWNAGPAEPSATYVLAGAR